MWLFLFLLRGEIWSCLYANGQHLVKRKTIGDAGEAGGNAKANSEKQKGIESRMQTFLPVGYPFVTLLALFVVIHELFLL